MARYKKFNEELRREVTGEALTPIVRFPRKIWGGFVLAYFLTVLIMHILFTILPGEPVVSTIAMTIVLPIVLVGFIIKLARRMITVCERGILIGIEGIGFTFHSYDDVVIICKWDSSHMWMGIEEGWLIIFDPYVNKNEDNYHILDKKWKKIYKPIMDQMKRIYDNQWNEIYRPDIVLRTINELQDFIGKVNRGETPWLDWGEG
jgi:hypothetical protein